MVVVWCGGGATVVLTFSLCSLNDVVFLASVRCSHAVIFQISCFFMAALGHYIFALWFLSSSIFFLFLA